MKTLMMSIFHFVLAACAVLSLHAQTLFFVAKNPVLIPGSPQRFQFEVWMRTNDLTNTLRMGSCILYMNYSSVPFGTSVAAGARVTVTKNTGVFGASYSMNPINDNTATRFAFSWTYVGGTGNGVILPSDINGVLAFTVQLQVTGISAAGSGIDFQNSLMDGEQYLDDETAVWPAQLGVSFISSGPLPVQLASFTAQSVPPSSVRLSWRTISEINNYGFHLEKKWNTDSSFTELPNSFIAGHGTTNERHDYTFTDNSPNAPTLWYRLRQVDLDGTPHWTEPIQVAGIVLSVDGKELAPIEFALKQNYPNPFNPTTEIRFSVERLDRATLEVFNIIGQKIATLFDGIAEPGQYYRLRFDGSSVASGMYILKLESGTRNQIRRMLLLK